MTDLTIRIKKNKDGPASLACVRRDGSRLGPVETCQQVPLNIEPLGREDAEHDAVADGAIAALVVVANHSVEPGPQTGNGLLRCEIEIVSSQPDDFAAERVESVAEQEELAAGVDVRPLP